MTETTEPTICHECAWGGGFHAETCSRHFVMPLTTMPVAEASLRPNREAEYRRIWLERAGAIFDKESGFASDGRCDARLAFKAADMFIAELRNRDGEDV